MSGTPEPATAAAPPHPQPRREPETPAAQPPSTTRKLASLSVDEVCILLHNLELGKYETGFRAVPVNSAILATINDEGLREVGVETGVYRTALLHHVTNFTVGGVPPQLLVSSPFDLWTCERALFWRCPKDSLCPHYFLRRSLKRAEPHTLSPMLARPRACLHAARNSWLKHLTPIAPVCRSSI